MHKKAFIYFIFSILLIVNTALFAQKTDSIIVKKDSVSKTTQAASSTPKHNPRIATKRSLILPGWGQAYNKEYWKIPIVYGALSIPTITFFYNNTVYKETKFAYQARFKAAQLGATKADSTDYFTLEDKFKRADINAIQTVRNAARRDRDFSVLWFLIVWGLNVADATVFGHLKDFNVSSDLAMNVQPNFNPSTRTPGLTLNFKFRDKQKKTLVVQ